MKMLLGRIDVKVVPQEMIRWNRRWFISDMAFAIRKNRVILIIMVLSVTALVTMCSINSREERVPQAMIRQDKMWFASDMGFSARFVWEGRVVNCHITALRVTSPRDPRFDPFYDELVFVHSEAEAYGFPDNVIVAWPRMYIGDTDIPRMQRIINRMHLSIRNARFRDEGVLYREPFTLEDFGLTHPLTIEDFVDNWEKVNALWRAFDSWERNFILP